MNLKKKELTTIFILAAMLISLSILFTYSTMNSKLHIDSKDFVGTYSVESSNNNEYLSIINDLETNSKYTYVLYDKNESYIKNGITENTNNNYITLYEDEQVVATLVFLLEDFYLIQNGQEMLKITKVSNVPVI